MKKKERKKERNCNNWQVHEGKSKTNKQIQKG